MGKYLQEHWPLNICFILLKEARIPKLNRHRFMWLLPCTLCLYIKIKWVTSLFFMYLLRLISDIVGLTHQLFSNRSGITTASIQSLPSTLFLCRHSIIHSISHPHTSPPLSQVKTQIPLTDSCKYCQLIETGKWLITSLTSLSLTRIIKKQIAEKHENTKYMLENG